MMDADRFNQPLSADKALELVARTRGGLAGAILGQRAAVDLAMIAVLAGGHGLMVGAPGLAKTSLALALAEVFGLRGGRIQFTPDLTPADITGSEILETQSDGTRGFRFLQGPLFAQLVVADEINRASPRTQSALLQAMQEGRITAGGTDHRLPAPFHVFATQNPIEHEGAYPLPEAQLDRFLLRIDIGLPDRDTERAVVLATTGGGTLAPERAMEPGDLAALQAFVRDMPLGEQVLEGALDLVRAARPDTARAPDVRSAVAWGPGPRATQALVMCAKARALIGGRLAPSRADLAALSVPAMAHRMALDWRARADGLDTAGLVARLTEDVLGLPAAAAAPVQPDAA